MGVLQVGPGYIWVKNTAGLVTAVGVLESGTLGPFTVTQKYAGGPYQLDEYAANTELKIEGKIEFKSLDLPLLLALGLSQYTDGTTNLSDVPVYDVPSTIATQTVTIAGATQILRVRDPLTGVNLLQVASAPTAGQFSVAGTVITVAAADATAWGSTKPLVSYVKAATSDSHKVNLVNAMQQEAVYFGLMFQGIFSGRAVVGNFLRCVSKSLPLFEGKSDFAKREFDVHVLADPNLHTIGTLTLAESLT